jgi:hypothetical protein
VERGPGSPTAVNLSGASAGMTEVRQGISRRPRDGLEKRQREMREGLLGYLWAADCLQ